MDTPTAISILQTRNQNIAAQMDAFQKEFDANTLSISQLQGTLDTQLKDLQIATATLAAQNLNIDGTPLVATVPATP